MLRLHQRHALNPSPENQLPIPLPGITLREQKKYNYLGQVNT